MKTSKNDVSNEELARMMAKGFEEMATKTDLTELKRDLKQDIETINLRLDNVAFKFEVKELDRRVTKLENKTSPNS